MSSDRNATAMHPYSMIGLVDQLKNVQISQPSNIEKLTKSQRKRRNYKANKQKRATAEMQEALRSNPSEASDSESHSESESDAVSENDLTSNNSQDQELLEKFQKIEKKIKKMSECNDDEIEHPWKRKFNKCSNYCIHKAAKFREETKKWLRNPVKKASRKQHAVQRTPMKVNTMSDVGETKPYAVYRIIKFASGKYYLTPIYRAIFATDRADLRMILLDDSARDSINETAFWMGALFDGDLIGVKRMSPTMEMPRNGLPAKNDDPNVVIEMDYKPIWRVDEFFILPREYQEDVLVCCYQVRLDKISLAGFGFDRPIKMKKSFFPITPIVEKLYNADLFVPRKEIDCYLEDVEGAIDSKDYYHLSKFASRLLFFSRPALTPISIREADPDFLPLLKDAPTAFRNYEDPLITLHFGMTFASSVISTVSNDDFDYQVYNSPFEIVRKRNGRMDDDARIIANFYIRKDTGPPSIKLWKPSTKINLIIPQGRIRGVVLSSIRKNRYLIITARFTAGNVKPFRKAVFSSGSKMRAVVEQIENPEDVVFKTLMALKTEEKKGMSSNAYKLLSALFGGSRIRQDENRESGNVHTGKLRHVRPNKGPSYYLDEHQSKYVDMVGRKYPGIVANSPFGCGKTTTMAVTQLELSEETPTKIHLTIGMTNSSVVNLVEAAARLNVDDNIETNILRLITARNRIDLDKNCQTDYDYPVIRDQCFKNFVQVVDKQFANSNLPSEEKIKDFKLALAYLIKNDLIDIDALRSSFATDSYSALKKLLKRTQPDMGALNTLLFKLYKPKRISATVSTALLSTWEFFRDRVSTIQIDEASQLPQTAFFALVETFPNACFTLVGDYHQLPPFCDQLTTKLARTIGIGKMLKNAYSQQLIPAVTLHYVYRCHPEITSVLGSAFYEYQLLSSVKAEDRRSKVKELKFWKNTSYPLLFVQSSGRAESSHKSLFNVREIDIVEKLVESMETVIETKDIGIATFYKAQTNMLMRKYQESDLFIGTVDSFQGREKEVVIVCLTNNLGKPSGFLLDKERINVALSRARRALIIIGNAKMLVGSPWASILKSIQMNKNICEDEIFFGKNDTINTSNNTSQKRAQLNFQFRKTFFKQ